MKNSSFVDNVAIITGASTGIGRELALQLADQGAWLALAARNTEKLEGVAAQCRERGGKTLVVPTDVTEPRQCAELIEQTVSMYGRIVGISSASGKWGLPKVTGYAASKHAMAGFFDSLRIELSDCSVSVTMVYPSFVATRGRKVSRAIMPVETCVRSIVKATVQRKRELFIPSLLGKVGLWFRLISPWLFDRYVRRVMEGQDI